MSTPRRGLAALVAAAICLISSSALAIDDPTLDWRTIKTAHFRIHYPRHTEKVAERIATLAENIHDQITGSLAHVPKSVTEVVLTDNSDSANGSATALPYNTIRLYLTAPDDLSPLGDYDDWYYALFAHEYTHILHLDNISGLPAIANAVLGKTLAPNQVQPRWIIEGLAVVSESQHTSAGRIRSSLFDMYLRADVLDDRIAGIDQFSSNVYRWPLGNIWYLYGSRFLRWITDIYGPNTMRAVSADYGSWIVPFGINRSIRRVTGRTYVELYDGFKDYIRRHYADQMREVERRGLREGTQITHHGRVVAYPRFVPANARKTDAEELVYYRDDYHNLSGIYRIPLAAPREGERHEELIARVNGNTTSTFAPTGDLLFNSTSVFKNVYRRDDLFRLPRGETAPWGNESALRRLTKGLRARSVDMSPDGRKLTFVVNNKGTSFLEIADLTPENELEERRDLVPSGPFDQAYTPRFSPDGKKIAYSAWSAGGYRDIRIVEVESGSFVEITHDRALDMNPVWSKDGKTIYFSSDRTGIFNIYAFDLATRKLSQVTNVRTGAVQPAVSDDEKSLVYVGYSSRGYDLFAMRIDKARFLDALPAPKDRPAPPSEPRPHVSFVKEAYSPLSTLAPRRYSIDYRPGYYSANALTVSARGYDVVGFHDLGATLTLDPSAPAPSFSFDYKYGRLPIDFSLRFFRSVLPRGGYRINDEEPIYNETTTGITAGVTYPLRGNFDAHSLGLSYSAAYFKGDLPVGSQLDPYATTTRDPPSGTINIVHLGYAYSNAVGSLDAAGTARGVSLQLGIDLADTYTGSRYSVRALSGSFSAYVPMPWRGHHTLALRTAGAVSAGSYPRGGTYGVGGYDLENNSLLTTALSGVLNGAFVLRGYPSRAYNGSAYMLQNVEYRIPIIQPDRGLSTLPIYLRRIDANLFWDYGGAFQSLRFDRIGFFRNGAIIDSPDLHTSIGAELWFGLSLGHTANAQLRLGYAYGFSPEAIPYGQPYLVFSSAF